MAQKFTTTAYQNLDDFIYGKSLQPVPLKNGMSIGGGTVYPEVNFTLPPMSITQDTMPEVLRNYKEMITGICERAKDLYVPGFVVELETLPPMTLTPQWGVEVCKTVKDVLATYEANHGIKSAIRFTPVDMREGNDLEHMWRGKQWDAVLEVLEGASKAGADFLSIESVGGKESHDEAIMFGELDKSIFALGIIGCQDMNKLWTEIVKISDKAGIVPAGDSACGFANTAMVLADRGMVPKVFSAAIRVVAAVRALVAIECGAKGPHKDCGYEGAYLKAITGTPISMEGRTAACAHLSPIGNVAFCVADIWSNESIQNIKLLGGMAPTVSFEQLVYDCRLMNEATARGKEAALLMRDLHADSDSRLDPQAYVLRPDVVLNISKELVKVDGYYERSKAATLLALEYMQKAYNNKELMIDDREVMYLDMLGETVNMMPKTESECIEQMIPRCTKLDPKKYDMA